MVRDISETKLALDLSVVSDLEKLRMFKKLRILEKLSDERLLRECTGSKRTQELSNAKNFLRS